MNSGHTFHDPLTRRRFLAASAGTALSIPLTDSAPAADDASTAVYQATGVKVGEVDDHSAIIWTRLTASPTRNNAGVVIPEQKGKRSRGQKSRSRLMKSKGLVPARRDAFAFAMEPRPT